MWTSPRIRTCVAIVMIATLAAPSTARAAAPDFDALRTRSPYVPLWTQVVACHRVEHVNGLTGDVSDRRLDALVRWFGHFNSQVSNRFLLGRDCIGSSTSTLATKLAARGVWVSTYRNGSSTSQSNRSANLNFYEAGDLEATAPLAIGTFWPGDWSPSRPSNPTSGGARLTRALSATATTVPVRSIGTASRPSGAGPAWPFLPSRGSGLDAGATSRNTHDVVSWIRVDDELLQVIEPPVVVDGVVRLQVRRGLWGTDIVEHAAGSRVLAPLYVGSAAQDADLAGIPERNDPDVPLRYGLKVWKDAAQRWLIGRIAATFGPTWQGHNAIWLDTTSCVQYSVADAYGNLVTGWDERIDEKLTPERWGAAQRSKIAETREAFPSKKVIANNLANANRCTTKLLADVDAGAFEHWLRWGNGRTLDWTGALAHLGRMQDADLPVTLWVRWDYGFSGSEARYRRFSYGSYLLVRRHAATRTFFGGPWDLLRPESLFFWNWGGPLESGDELASLRIPGTELYRRRFRNGMILVNPSSDPVTYALGGIYYDVVDRTSGQPSPVTTVTVGSRDATFLLSSV